MFQPFERLKKEHINGLIKLHKNYLVTQSYPQAFDHFEEPKIDILMTDYDGKGLAQIHYKAIRNDNYACILDLQNAVHRQKLLDMVETGSDYRVFWAVVKNMDEVKKRLDLKYKNNIRRYITIHTNWRIGADEIVKPSLQVVYGELFITLKRGSQSIRIKFEEIEKV